MEWLHFIGKEYYKTIKDFAKEAEQYGVSRRISKTTVRNMRYGDAVYLFQGTRKNSTLFGYFVIDTIFGSFERGIYQDPNFTRHLVSAEPARTEVVRGCGSFVTGVRMATRLPLNEMVRLAEEHGVGNMMVGGKFYRHKKINSVIPFQQGFRLFNYSGFMDAFSRLSTPGRRVKGMWYVLTDTATSVDYDSDDAPVTQGHIVTLETYERRGHVAA